MATSENGHAENLYTYDSFTGNGPRGRKPLESHFLWWCAGAYQAILKDCPTEQTKYAGLGGVLLATFILAALSAGYAVYSVFDNPLWSIIFAVIWGFIIFNFDRFLVSTMRKYGVPLKKQIWMTVPRILLALLIGFTIARPLELKIFEKEIDVQIIENRHKKVLLNDSLLLAESQSVISAAQMERARLNGRRLILEDTLHRLQEAYIREADGTGGSQRRGIDRLTRLKQEAYESAMRQYAPELARLQQQLSYQDSLLLGANAMREVKNRKYDAQVTADVGFLEKNKALADLAAREPSVFWANLLISLLIILIEIGPILSKLMMGTGPYDLALAKTELLQMASSEEEIRRDRELVYEKRKGIFAKKREMTSELVKKLSDLQKKHVQEELDQWERGEDKNIPRRNMDDLAKKIRQKYDYHEEDIL